MSNRKIRKDRKAARSLVQRFIEDEVVPPSPCEKCREPGHCCKAFTLNVRLDPQHPQGVAGHATEVLKHNNLEFFRFIGIEQQNETEAFGYFTCTRLAADGRCSRYDERPNLCRIYQPLKDAICIENEEPGSVEKRFKMKNAIYLQQV